MLGACAEEALRVGDQAGALSLGGARGEHYLVRLAQIERDVCGGLIPLLRARLEATQDDLLKPRRNVGHDGGGRHRIEPEAIAHVGVRLAERQRARHGFVQHDPEREEIAPQVLARAEQLLGRNVRRRAGAEPRFLREEVGITSMVREAEIDENGAAIGSQHHVGRLEIEVNHLLLMHAVERVSDRCADRGRIGRWEGSRREPVCERPALDPLGHEIGCPREIARRHERRDVRSLQDGKDGRLRLVPDEALSRELGPDPRHLHDERQCDAGLRHSIQAPHPAFVHPLADGEAVDLGAGLDARHAHDSVTPCGAVGVDAWCQFAAWLSDALRLPLGAAAGNALVHGKNP